MAVGILAFTINPLPIVLRMLGWMPENGDPMLFPIILIVNTLDVGLIVTYQILAASMIADLVEDSEIRTARRSEGVFFASVTFVRKVVQGFGAMMAATILTLSEFPVGATPGTVPEEALITFALYYVPTVFTVWMLMIFSISFYQVDREKHQQNLESLGRR
jgi:GPH family glycoside/pentoside/hexuronide:cation symporter